MIYLLDTHALLWSLTDPTLLGAEARTVIARRSSRLLASAASALEIATKQRLGKLPGTDVLVEGYLRHLDTLGVERLPISEQQAMIESATLITMDPELTSLSGLSALW